MKAPVKQVFCDFDGTITEIDAVDAILNKFANPQWKEWENLWRAGEISAHECLARQTKLIRATRFELLSFSRSLPIDPAFEELANACASRSIPLIIVSDGYDVVIQATLHRLGLSHIPFFANRLEWKMDGSLRLGFPHQRGGCEGGMCKCLMTERQRPKSSFSVYIGDGRSDFCVSQTMDMVYAKSDLAAWMRRENLPYRPFDGLADVVRDLFLTEIWV